jgi:hypothetical protein
MRDPAGLVRPASLEGQPRPDGVSSESVVLSYVASGIHMHTRPRTQSRSPPHNGDHHINHRRADVAVEEVLNRPDIGAILEQVGRGYEQAVGAGDRIPAGGRRRAPPSGGGGSRRWRVSWST